MPFSRRGLVAAAPAGLAAAVLVSAQAVAQPANDTTTDLAVSCDLAIAAAVQAAGAAYRKRSGVRVRLFPTHPGLLVPQLQREIQNDIIVTTVATLDQAEKAGLVKPGGRVGPWRNQLVVAEAKSPAGPMNSFAIPDPTPASEIDGPAILQHLAPPSGPIIGVLDTDAVAWALLNGTARQGLLHQTQVVANAPLRTVAPVPDAAWPPIFYAATVTTLAYRGNPPAFIAFLGSAEGKSVLHAAGLEIAS